MKQSEIKYQSFCWVLGTTSFRTAKLNLKIEQQLLLLHKLYKKINQQEKTWIWNGNTALQTELYDLMHKEGFLTGEASRKDKDARQKTSGLVDIGLINQDRILTPAGKALLSLTQHNDFKADNEFHLEKDSYIYFKQLLKATLNIDKHYVRPYLVLAHLLSELNELSYDEFCYFLPLCISKETTERMIQTIRLYRQKSISLYDVIYSHLMTLENYQFAFQALLENTITEEVICMIGMNRKSANYDKPYYILYSALETYFLNKQSTAIDLFNAIKKIKRNILWNQLIFKTTSPSSIKKQNQASIQPNCPFLHIKTEEEFKRTFFKYLHVFKAMATLRDYFDLNRRYFNLTDTLIFDDQKVKFDLIPQYFFHSCDKSLFLDAFLPSKQMGEDIELAQIHKVLIFNAQDIYQRIYQDYGIKISDGEQAAKLIQDERHQRFNRLIDHRFGKTTLLDLLTHFKTRNDDEIAKIVTDEADIPTIFEYILAIIWYEISERQGDILNYMNLSLSADLLPKTHAAGGEADIVYRYTKTNIYPDHTLLIEATLAESSNQRRMEMEPVSRHLGEYRLKSRNDFDYCLFITTYLHRNVIADFRGRKENLYYGQNDEYIENMKIIPIDTDFLAHLLRYGETYRQLYPFFEAQYHSSLKPKEWYENMVREKEVPYFVN